MVNKKIIIITLSIFLVSLLTISIASATDNTTSDIVAVEDTIESNTFYDVLSINDIENENITNGQNSLGSIESQDEILIDNNIESPTHTSYSVMISDTDIISESGGLISMKVSLASSASNYGYEYNYYFKVYDSNNYVQISQLYRGSHTGTPTNVYYNTYSINSNQLSSGDYTMKIINCADNEVMSAAKLTVKSPIQLKTYPTPAVYSVKVYDTVAKYSGGNIYMSVTPASNIYTYKYYFYLKIYDSNNNVILSKCYSGTDEIHSQTCHIIPQSLNLYANVDYTIKILDKDENSVISAAKLKIGDSPYPPSSNYSVNVSNSYVTYGNMGTINMSISPSYSSTYKYYYYLKVYDSNNIEKISELYYGTDDCYSKVYSVDANKLNAGTYTIKIINHGDSKVMNTASLTVNPSTYPHASDYSVSVSSCNINYGSAGSISMKIFSNSNSTSYKYYYYLKIVYSSNDYEKISQLYYNSYNSSSYITNYTINTNQLDPGDYTIKIINFADNKVMATAPLIVKLTSSDYPSYSDYSVSVSSSTIVYDSNEVIKMNITPASESSYYKYYYYLKVYDSNSNERITALYHDTYITYSKTYSIGKFLGVGTYTIKIINYADNKVMNIATLTIKPAGCPSYSDYSVNVYAPTIKKGHSGIIKMNITPASDHTYKYYYYLKIYDLNNNEKISQLYSGTNNDYSKTYTIDENKLSTGIYNAKIINYIDNELMNTMQFRVISPEYPSSSDYSVSVSNFTINSGSSANIKMSITTSPDSNYTYFYTLKVYDSDNNEKFSKLYYGTDKVYSKTYTIDSDYLGVGTYTIKIYNYADGKLMNTSSLTVKSTACPYSSDYSVSVSNTTIEYPFSGSITMRITPASNYTYRYYYYLKVYDSNNTEIISEFYSGKDDTYYKNYAIDANQLGRGNYTIKIINYIDNKILDVASLTINNSTPILPSSSDYSVNIINTIISYDSNGIIKMNITPASDHTYKYYYYLKIYDLNNNEKISQLYSGTNNDYSKTYTISANKLSMGSYTIKIINYADNETMNLAILNVKSGKPNASDYSVSVSNTTINYDSKGSIKMTINPASSYTYKYYYYFEIYDVNNNRKLSTTYSSTINAYSKDYIIDANKLIPGKYTIKIINYIDKIVMSTATLTVNPSVTIPTYPIASDYSVNISDLTMNEDSIKAIKMNINSSSNSIYKYYYYLKVYDSNNNEIISELCSGTGNSDSITYGTGASKLSVGTYSVKIVNFEDNVVMSTATLTVKSKYPAASDYSVNISDLTINYGYSGQIKMNITPASSNYKYYYYLKVYDSNNNEIISELYSGTYNTVSKTYSIVASKLSVGTYSVKIVNFEDNVVMSAATLTVKSKYPAASDYSVNISDLTINYGYSGQIKMNITPASSNYKYYYYLKVYDSNNNEIISELYSGTYNTVSKTYSIVASKLSVGTYSVKIVNFEDNVVMSAATLTVRSEYPAASDYSVNVSDLTINYGYSGQIKMNITPASSNYKYYYYLKVYDSNNNEKISNVYYDTTNSYSKTYTISPNDLISGIYTIKVINYDDNKVMSIATLTVKSNESIVTPDDNSTKPIPEIVIPPLNDISNDGSVSIKLPSDATGVVTLTINNKDYNFAVVNGVANVAPPNLDNGNYLYTITYSGDNKYSSFTSSNTLKVYNKVIKKYSVLSCNPVTTVYNGGKYLIAVLKDSDSNPIVDAKVTIVLNGKTYAPTTDSNGQVKVSTNNLVPGGYVATINFEGNNNYIKSVSIEKVIVKKATPKITAKSKTFKKSVKTKMYTITLKNNLNKVMKNTKLTIKVNKKTYTAITNKKGVATFKITKLTKKGTFKSVITYNGNKYYNKVNKTVKIKIK